MSALRTLPPSFSGDPYTYGLALFALILVSMLSVARLWDLSVDVQRTTHFGFVAPVMREAWTTPLTLYRCKLGCLYLAFFVLTFPDVLILLLWGEATTPTIETLMVLNRICDGASLLPFLTGMMIGAWIDQVVPQKLVSSGVRNEMLPFTYMRIKPTLRIALFVAVIAAGVTVGKVTVA